MGQDGLQIRDKIISFINLKGPSLPVQIAKETGLSILFASAFLSELFGEKILKISNIKVGSSPLYFIPGQEPQLEKFYHYLKSKEKEAFLLLKEKKIIKDSEQQPAIRVALREIKDFAIPFEKNEEVFWRYFLIEEPSEIIEETEIKSEIIKENEELNENKQEEKLEEEKQKEELNIIEETKKEKTKKIKKTKPENKTKKAGKKDKKNENFFNKIKEFLSKKKIEIIDIKDFKNDEAILKIKKDDDEELLFVFNKKNIEDKEIIKAWKKASELKMPYSILTLGEPSKKMNELISAFKGLSELNRLE